MPVSSLYTKCRERFLVSSQVTLNSHLTEFKDHDLIKIKKHSDGQDCLHIPLVPDALGKLLQELSWYSEFLPFWLIIWFSKTLPKEMIYLLHVVTMETTQLSIPYCCTSIIQHLDLWDGWMLHVTHVILYFLVSAFLLWVSVWHWVISMGDCIQKAMFDSILDRSKRAAHISQLPSVRPTYLLYIFGCICSQLLNLSFFQ